MLHQEVKKYLLSLPTDELIDIVFSAYGYTYELEHIITYPNDSESFNTLFAEPLDAVRATFYGDYRYTDEYIVINRLGNIDSYNSINIRDLYVDYIDDITWVVIENDLLTEDVVDVIENNVHEQIINNLKNKEC